MGLADEVEHGETILPRCMAQTAPQLLQKDGNEALRGTEEKDGVHLRHINTFAQLVDGKEEREPSGLQILQQLVQRPSSTPDTKAAEGIPRWVNCSAMKTACLMVTQKPIPLIVFRSGS